MTLKGRGSLITFWILLLGLGGGAWYWWTQPREEASPLTTATASQGDVIETVSATGTVQAVTTVQVGTQVSGSIKALYADFNSRVRRGQVIAELEPSLFESEVEQSKASLTRLQSEVEGAKVQAADAAARLARAEALSRQQLLAAVDLDTARATSASAAAAVKSAEAQVAQAEASLTQSQVNLSHAVIRAPIDGVVVSRNVDVGQTVAASMQAPTIFVIAQDLREMQVNASIDEADIGRIAAGQPVSFRVDAFPGQPFTGEVVQVRLNPVVEQNVVSYVTVIRVPNPDLRLKPGMTASVIVEVARADDAVRVPSAALRFRPSADVLARFGETDASQSAQQTSASKGDAQPARYVRPDAGGPSEESAHVWVFDGSQIREVAVAAGVSDGSMTEVTGDIFEGETVVVNATAPATPSRTSMTTTSPLIPQRPGRAQGAGQRGTTNGGRQ